MPTVPADEEALTRALIALASEYGRYGYRRVTSLLQAAGWQVGELCRILGDGGGQAAR